MGAYFKCHPKAKFVIKTLIKKKGGSPYPSIAEFTKKINLLKKYLGDFIPETEILCDGKHIGVKQAKVEGDDLFHYLKENKPQRFDDFLLGLTNLYKETGMLPDLLNKGNILVTASGEIKIIDIWPLFFEKRVKTSDINKESYEENLGKFGTLKKQHTKKSLP